MFLWRNIANPYYPFLSGAVIKGYIKCHTELGNDAKQINEPQSISMQAILRWNKAFNP